MTKQRNILQWNMGCSRLASVKSNVIDARLLTLKNLLGERSPSVVALQEAPQQATTLLQQGGFTVYGSGELLLGMRNCDWKKGQTVLQQSRVLTVEVQLTTQRILLVSNVHLLSRQHSEQLDREDAAREILTALVAQRVKYVNQVCGEIIVGDFNLNPHDGVMMMKNGFFSNRSRTFVKKMAKKSVLPKKPLYNPSWHIYGRAEEPLGSLYDTNPGDGPWLVFDQILMSADLIDAGSHEVVLVTGTKGVGLLTAPPVKRPDKAIGSDHLPLVSKFCV